MIPLGSRQSHDLGWKILARPHEIINDKYDKHQANGILLFSKNGVACERRIKVSNGVFEDLILADAWHRNGNSEPISEGFPDGLEGCITL